MRIEHKKTESESGKKDKERRSREEYDSRDAKRNDAGNAIKGKNTPDNNFSIDTKKIREVFNLDTFRFDKLSYVKNKIESDKKHEEHEIKRKEEEHKKQEKIQDKNLRKLIKKKIKEKKTGGQRKRFFEDNIEKAGLEIKLPDLQKKILIVSSVMVILEAILLIIFNAVNGAGIFQIIFDSILLLALGIVLHYNVIMLSFFTYIDIKIYQRKKAVEEVLPEYLQLVAANISAGIPIDQSLWLAVRPQFGVLSKEIEIVAKKSLTGTNLNEALMEFSKKYDSVLLKRTIHLIIEGIDAGGPLANLLERITTDIIETKIMKKEMAANVMTYVIFITFASIVAAPFMFGLANQLVNIITNLMGSLDLSNMQSSSFAISKDAILIGDFQIFSVVLLSVTAIFSGMIISVIKNGNIRDGLQNIPVLIGISLAIYLVAIKLLGLMFAGMF